MATVDVNEELKEKDAELKTNNEKLIAENQVPNYFNKKNYTLTYIINCNGIVITRDKVQGVCLCGIFYNTPILGHM